MKYFIFVFFILFIIVSCYQYVEERSETRLIAIDVPVIKPADLLDASIKTNKELLTAAISVAEPTVSQAVMGSTMRFFRERGIKVARISERSVYKIIKAVPNKTFRSRNRNKVFIGEKFNFRLPKIVDVKLMADNYYLFVNRKYGLENLKDVLNFKWLKSYEPNEFDCSEMSAFLEYWLERNGFNADIVLDLTHSWVVVEVEPSNWIHVEATGVNPSIITERKYIRRLKDIYDAMNYFRDECDWWKGMRNEGEVIGKI
ncbi:MAG: hypothetical protein KKG02_10800 [Candidatus Edwardsbacteria bacterium]|nr:hypothetical protein [Candidatus Edwardsbacteria bacterium]